MALALRLRRAVAISGSLLKDCHFSSIFSSVPPPLTSASNPSLAPQLRLSSLFSIQTQSFRSSTPLSNRRADFGNLENEIKPDDILFEGCDYNHWLITMDFPKDPKPTPEEMVETYVQTCAKVLGSVEEAKKKMYACSTTTYNGFQAVMTEEMSEKFRGLPGVVFILPDSYIDPVNKEYGGDKYENGVITPRPPPIQYGRRGRYDDRNRNYERPRFEENDRQREPMQSQQGYPPKDHSNSMQGDGRSYNPQQNYGQSGQDGRGYGPPRNFSPSGDNSRDFGRGQQRNFGQDGRDHAAGGRDGYQWERRDPMTPHQRDFGRGQQGNFAPQEQRNFSEGQRGDYRYAGPSVPGDRQGAAPGSRVEYRGAVPGYSGEHRQDPNFGYSGENKQGAGSGYGADFKQGPDSDSRVEYRGAGPGYSGEHRQGPNFGYSGDNKQGAGSGYGADFKQGSDSGYGQNYPGPVEGQSEPWQGKY